LDCFDAYLLEFVFICIYYLVGALVKIEEDIMRVMRLENEVKS